MGDQYITFLIDNYPELSDLDNNYSPDVISVYRKALSEAPDSSVKFIVVGLKKDMADLLQSGPDEFSPLSGSDLIAQKVIGVYDMGGIFPSGKEFNYELEPASTKYYIENCPVPLFLAGDCWGGMQIGETLRTLNTPPGRALDHKLAGNGGIYWDGKPVEDYQAGFDCAPVFAAVRGEDAYFNVIAGCNNISDDGSNSFDEEGSCNQVYAPCSNPKISLEDMAIEIEEMIITPPVNGDDGKYQLNVVIQGSGKVSPSSGRFTKDTTITIVATANSGNAFAGWSGDLLGTDNPTTITINSNKIVKAKFEEVINQFTATIVGEGSVSPANGIYSGVINIVASPDDGYKFESWSGDINSTNSWEVISMDSSIHVTATFISTSSVGEQNENILNFEIYPNPFAKILNIEYQITTPSFVKLSIYNNGWQEVVRLVDEKKNRGDYHMQWDGMDSTGIEISNGVYFSVLQVGEQRIVKKIILNSN